MSLDVNDLRIATTLLSLAVFIGILVWALARRRRRAFDEAARAPLDDDR